MRRNKWAVIVVVLANGICHADTFEMPIVGLDGFTGRLGNTSDKSEPFDFGFAFSEVSSVSLRVSATAVPGFWFGNFIEDYCPRQINFAEFNFNVNDPHDQLIASGYQSILSGELFAWNLSLRPVNAGLSRLQQGQGSVSVRDAGLMSFCSYFPLDYP